MTIAIGCSISWPGIEPATISGKSARPVVERRHQNRRQPLARAAYHERRAERLALVLLQMLEVVDQHDAVARGDAEHREEADERTERDNAVAQIGGQHAAHQRGGQQQKGQQSPAARS